MSKHRPPAIDRGPAPEEGFDAAFRAGPDSWTEAERREFATLSALSDVEILRRAGNLGPAMIGRPLAHRAALVRQNNPEGTFGPALLDPDYDAKSLAKRGLRRTEEGRIEPLDAPAGTGVAALDNPDDFEGGEPVDALDPDSPIDPTDLDDPRNAWMYVTLSGAKQLAVEHSVSHKPRPNRRELIALLQQHGVKPPSIPEPERETPDAEDLDKQRRARLETDLERTNPGASGDTR